MIGIDNSTGVCYEGRGTVGIAIWPVPSLLPPATVLVRDADGELAPLKVAVSCLPLLFREDQFDPVTRIRRGRLYNPTDGVLEQKWSVRPNPSAPHEGAAARPDGYLRKRLRTYHCWAAGTHLSAGARGTFLALGSSKENLWKVIAIEELYTTEHLVTLKARFNMGVLPEIDGQKVPEADRKPILKAAERIVDTAHRAGPESTIDRCREFATVALSSRLSIRGKDLGDLAVAAGEKKKFLLQSCARVLAILHSRTKTAEQQSRGIPHPTEEDAELALHCAGAIVRMAHVMTPEFKLMAVQYRRESEHGCTRVIAIRRNLRERDRTGGGSLRNRTSKTTAAIECGGLDQGAPGLRPRHGTN
jgi:hypothetical protein